MKDNWTEFFCTVSDLITSLDVKQTYSSMVKILVSKYKHRQSILDQNTSSLLVAFFTQKSYLFIHLMSLPFHLVTHGMLVGGDCRRRWCDCGQVLCYLLDPGLFPSLQKAQGADSEDSEGTGTHQRPAGWLRMTVMQGPIFSWDLWSFHKSSPFSQEKKAYSRSFEGFVFCPVDVLKHPCFTICDSAYWFRLPTASLRGFLLGDGDSKSQILFSAANKAQ